MRQALELARAGDRSAGHGEIGCVIVMDGRVVGAGCNEAEASHDPTAHAEIVAIRRAAAALATTELRGATLYSTLQPCGMCSMASIWARIGRVVYGAGRHQVHESYFEGRHLDTMDFINDAFRDDLDVVGGVLGDECATLYSAARRQRAAGRADEHLSRSRERRMTDGYDHLRNESPRRPRLRLVGDGPGRRAPRLAVAVPVRNEVDRIGPCLRALARQEGAMADRVVLLLNGCIDGTQAVIRDLAPTLAVNVAVVERDLRGEDATAGMARSLAVAEAARGLDDDDILMTTDADATVARNWVARNAAALAAGADIVCGRALLDPADAPLIPSHLHADDARECRLAALIDEMAALIDPEPHDPWPRHTEHSGASLAFTVAAWRRAGGIPPIPCGEDRAFVDRLRRGDARIRHDPAIEVTVSGRTQGRAAGGMADTIRRRILAQDEFVDSAIEPAADRFRRVSLRARARALWRGATAGRAALARCLNIPVANIDRALAAASFGEAWATLEQTCPVLFARRVRFRELPAQIEAAEALLAQVRVDLARAQRTDAAPAVHAASA